MVRGPRGDCSWAWVLLGGHQGDSGGERQWVAQGWGEGHFVYPCCFLMMGVLGREQDYSWSSFRGRRHL